jgi:RNase P subunit RPR2
MTNENNTYQMIMNLQIRLQALEIITDKDEFKLVNYKKSVDYPNLNKLFCPRCLAFDFRGGSATDEHDTYLIMRCHPCGFQYSPSHDSP